MHTALPDEITVLGCKLVNPLTTEDYSITAYGMMAIAEGHIDCDGWMSSVISNHVNRRASVKIAKYKGCYEVMAWNRNATDTINFKHTILIIRYEKQFYGRQKLTRRMFLYEDSQVRCGPITKYRAEIEDKWSNLLDGLD